MGVGLEDSVEDGVAVPVRDCELLGVPVRVAELLGVEVPVDVGELLNERVAELLGVPDRVAELLAVPVELGVADGLRVSDGEPVLERVDGGVWVRLEVPV